jgi:putative transcriptional regulator
LKLPRLKEVRELHGWSQKKLAEESGVSRDSISNYETGQREAWPATAKKLADALDVEIGELVLPKAPAREAGQREQIEVAEQLISVLEDASEPLAFILGEFRNLGEYEKNEVRPELEGLRRNICNACTALNRYLAEEHTR